MLIRYWEEGYEQYCKSVIHPQPGVLGGAIRVLLCKDDICMHAVNPIDRISVLDPKAHSLSPLDDMVMYSEPGVNLVVKRAKPIPRPIYSLLTLNCCSETRGPTVLSLGGREGPERQLLRGWDELAHGFVLMQQGGARISCQQTITLLLEDIPPEPAVGAAAERSTFSQIGTFVDGFSPLRLFGATLKPYEEGQPTPTPAPPLAATTPEAASAAPGPSFLGRAISVGSTIAAAPLAVLPRIHRVEPDWERFQPADLHGPAAADVAQQLHLLVRKGIPADRRKDVWPFLTGVEGLLKKRPRLVQYALQKTFPLTMQACGGDVDLALQRAAARHPPFFKGLKPFMNVDLHTDQLRATQVLLCMLAQANSHIEFCPALPTMVAFLMTYLDAKVAYAVAHNVLAVSSNATAHSSPEDGRCRFLAISGQQQQEELMAFDCIVQRKLPAVHRHGVLLKGDFTQFAGEWFPNLFAGCVPPETAFQIFDNFLVEGAYFLHLAGLALLRLAERTFLKHQSWGAAVRAVRQFVASVAGDALLAQAFAVHLTREELDAAVQAKHHVAPALPTLSIVDGLYFRPAVNPPSRIATEAMWEAVFFWLPKTAAVSQLTLQYCTAVDGFSLTTFYSKCSSTGDCLLLCKASPVPEAGAPAPEATEVVFGAYLSKSPHVSNTYYGDESCFVFTLVPQERQFLPVPVEELRSVPLEACKSDASAPESPQTSGPFRGNEYYINGFHTKFLVGGGGKGPAIELMADLQTGCSFASATYGNAPLSLTPSFNVLCLELYSTS
eukprot:EG_transcript_2922